MKTKDGQIPTNDIVKAICHMYEPGSDEYRMASTLVSTAIDWAWKNPNTAAQLQDMPGGKKELDWNKVEDIFNNVWNHDKSAGTATAYLRSILQEQPSSYAPSNQQLLAEVERLKGELEEARQIIEKQSGISLTAKQVTD